MSNIFLTMLSVILAENLIFTKMFGLSPFIKDSDKPSRALGMGVALTAVMTLSSVLTYVAYRYALVPLKLELLRTVVFVMIIALAAWLIGLVLKHFTPTLYDSLSLALPLSAVNCASMGAVLLNVKMHSSIADSALFGFAAGIGFTLALVIFAGVRAKMILSDPPKSFKGFPILLIAAGLIAMAFSGFAGMSFS